jgi:hypothetical protein
MAGELSVAGASAKVIMARKPYSPRLDNRIVASKV